VIFVAMVVPAFLAPLIGHLSDKVIFAHYDTMFIHSHPFFFLFSGEGKLFQLLE
jgi:hypothetical protein